MDLTHVRFEGAPKLRSRPERMPALRAQNARPARGRPVRPEDSPDAFGMPARILARSGLDPAAYRGGPLARRRGACLRALRAPSEQLALARLEADPDLVDTGLNTFLIGVSSFFRDAAVFETLRTNVVEALRARSGTLRVLSLGCSAGAELYSVAMLLADANLLPHSHLLGIDCRHGAVASARAGVFPAAEVEDLDAERRSRYLERTRSGWRIAEPLRRAAHWQLDDVTRGTPPGPWDLVLCRNLVIYLQPAVAETMIRNVAATLSPGGFLVVGKAERSPASLGLSIVGRCVYRKPIDGG
jgi:chemotaxis methyl-accepting protein methylase